MPDDDFELDALPPPPLTTTSPTELPELTLDEDQARFGVNESLGEDQFEDRQTISVSQEVTRSKIAWVFTQLFLLMVVTALVLPTVINVGFPGTFVDSLETTKELVTLIASVLAGPFGFIVGFYFKEREV